MNYTNKHNISLPLAVWLATDEYDHDPKTISATTLLKPIKQIILSKRMNTTDKFIDIADLVSSRMGTAIHSAIEKAWLNPTNALKLLGYSDKMIKRVKVNPTTVTDTDIPVYMEQRNYKEVLGYKVSGKFDFVAENKVHDIKSCSVYNYLNQTNAEKYIQQLSIYRWLNPKIITADTGTIHYVFTDWNKLDSLKNKDYPPIRVLTQSYPLMSLNDTHSFVEQKIHKIQECINLDEKDLPPCTDDELWRKPTVYKYYKNPESSRATKNFDTQTEASLFMVQNGNVGIIKEVKGQVIACRYCPAVTICKQAQSYLNSGDLVV